jgi:UDP-2,3-diacylglucosamine hydrolase
VGDVFDFWFEYKHAIPKGFVRLQGKIAELTDAGIKIHLFKGNHDMWIFDYLPKELGIELHDNIIQREFFGKKYIIGHGDGLGPGDFKYKFLKLIFRNKVCQWLFARIHPNFGIGIANLSSRKSRAATGKEDFIFSISSIFAPVRNSLLMSIFSADEFETVCTNLSHRSEFLFLSLHPTF